MNTFSATLDEQHLKTVVEENVVTRGPDYDVDLKKCATIFFDKAYAIFADSIEKFYEYVYLSCY